MMANESLICTRDVRGATTRLHLSGDLTAAGVVRLSEELRQAKQAGAEKILIDLGGLIVMDSTGFAFLKANQIYYSSLTIELTIGGLTADILTLFTPKESDTGLIEGWTHPLEAAANGPWLSEKSSKAAGAAKKLSDPKDWLIVVDDETLVLNYIAGFLRHNGYEVLRASEADEALRLLTEHRERVRLALVDLNLGGFSGLKLVEKMARIVPALKVILTSGMGEETLGDAVHPNICRRVQKPVFGEKLIQIIHETLE